jgi:hypothetical protein
VTWDSEQKLEFSAVNMMEYERSSHEYRNYERMDAKYCLDKALAMLLLRS